MSADLDAPVTTLPIIDRRGHRHVFGPRDSAIRYLLGQPVTNRDLLTDQSEWGDWGTGGPLEHRPPELWADLVHDHTWQGD